MANIDFKRDKAVAAKMNGVDGAPAIAQALDHPLVQKASEFASERPYLYSLVAVQIVVSALPIAAFAVFVLGAIAFTFTVGAIFVLFWAGVALLVLVPTLCFTAFVGTLLWAWLFGIAAAAKWVFTRSSFYRDDYDNDADSDIGDAGSELDNTGTKSFVKKPAPTSVPPKPLSENKKEDIAKE